MTREEAVAMIDEQNKRIVNPVELLHWVRLRVIINQIPDWEWEVAVNKAQEILLR